MKARRRTASWPRRAGTSGALVLLCGIGYLASATTLSQSLATREPDLALWWSPHNARAMVARGTAMWASGQRAEARRMFVSALEAEPLQQRALDGIALLDASEAKDVEPLVRIAAARSSHDELAHRWLLDIEARAGRYAAALWQADVVFRLPRTERAAEITTDLVGRTRDRAFADALVRTLASRPPWRGRVLEAMTASDLETARIEAFYASLRKADGVGRDEADLLTTRLLRDGRVDAAYLNWLAALSDDEVARAGPIYNGDFATRPQGTSFDWQITPVVGVDAAVRAGPPDSSLHIEFSGTRVVYRHVRHLLVLSPGAYKLRFEQRAEKLVNGVGLVWRLSCGGESAPLVTTPPLSGTAPWRAVSVAFQVPDGCPLQELRLELPARSALDSVISGTLAYRAFAIESAP